MDEHRLQAEGVHVRTVRITRERGLPLHERAGDAARGLVPLWRIRARKEDRLILPSREIKSGAATANSRTNALVAWIKIAQALDASDRPEDRRFASEVVRYIKHPRWSRACEATRA